VGHISRFAWRRKGGAARRTPAFPVPVSAMSRFPAMLCRHDIPARWRRRGTHACRFVRDPGMNRLVITDFPEAYGGMI
jgi:hypothetical protein